MAALALPGLGLAQDDPGPGTIAFKWSSYQDRQPGLDRIRVRSPALALHAPIGERWALDANASADSVSGASPRWHSAISSASRMSDERQAADLTITRYDELRVWSLGAAGSDENDFRSRALSASGRWTSEDRNRSWTAAAALRRDHIGSHDDSALDERRQTVEATLGVTQALSRQDLMQATLTHASGQGYYSDPYKRLDQRPRSRHQTIVMLRWNHHLEAARTTLRSQLRAYRDSFGIRSGTVAVEALWQPAQRWTLTPSLRLYSQSAAHFYFDPVYSFAGAPYPPGYFEAPAALMSPDQRLAAFGAIAIGLKLGVRLDDMWTADLKVEGYEQRGQWRVGGPGSPGLAPFSARSLQWGLARRF